MRRNFQMGPGAKRSPQQRPGNHPLPLFHRLAFHSNETPVATDPFSRNAAVARLEAALFAADEPLPARRLAEVAAVADFTTARECIDILRSQLNEEGSAFQVVEIAGGYQLMTRPEYHTWLIRLKRTGYDAKLTPAALETLALIAYKQPVMRAAVEAIRGVNVQELIKVLLEKGLVRVVGRHDSLGRPQLFGTTKKFLMLFGLSSTDDLPLVESLRPPPLSK